MNGVQVSDDPSSNEVAAHCRSYREGVKFTGMLYLREITESRFKGTAIRNLNMFRKLCGTDALQNVALVTTKWDTVSIDLAVKRETDLKNKFWKGMLDHGAKITRHDNTIASARRILNQLLGGPPVTLNIQAQLVDQGMNLGNTDAGSAVKEVNNTELRRLKDEMEETVKNFREEQDEVMKTAYRSHQEELEAQSRIFEEAQKQLSDDRTAEMAMLKQQLADAAKKSGKTTEDYMWEGVSATVQSFAQGFLSTVADTMMRRLLG
ncbi:hypothetical protein MMC27_000424 [Xylographa pallens]|nr:hypothetical protein [Xylographa pallens]